MSSCRASRSSKVISWGTVACTYSTSRSTSTVAEGSTLDLPPKLPLKAPPKDPEPRPKLRHQNLQSYSRVRFGVSATYNAPSNSFGGSGASGFGRGSGSFGGSFGEGFAGGVSGGRIVGGSLGGAAYNATNNNFESSGDLASGAGSFDGAGVGSGSFGGAGVTGGSFGRGAGAPPGEVIASYSTPANNSRASGGSAGGHGLGGSSSGFGGTSGGYFLVEVPAEANWEDTLARKSFFANIMTKNLVIYNCVYRRRSYLA
ncbi:glycine-rich protein 5-like [Penaeus chinensis]|uniref:glycine-rich protein 5-like n=1 Tax=Penaeus chinensis TaxID=139456 RepID=UPI001FB85674|nr:glycine-rich protein 5-like [Penaeus chinensis]